MTKVTQQQQQQCIFREKHPSNSKQSESMGKFSKITKCTKSLDKMYKQLEFEIKKI